MIDEPNIARACNLLATLVAEIRGLRADLAGRSRAAPRTISPGDESALACLLPLLHNVTDGTPFTVHQIMGEDAIHDALVRCGIDGNARKFGRLLRRCADADVEIGGLFVDTLGKQRAGTCFFVTADSRETRTATRFAAKMREKMTP